MRRITAGDSVQLVLRAVDANGAPVKGAVFYVKMLGGQGEGTVRPEELRAGRRARSGKFPLSVSALVPGTPAVRGLDLGRVLWRPGTGGAAGRLPRGGDHRRRADAPAERAAFSKANDRTADSVRWRSSAPKVVAVDRDGADHRARGGPRSVTASVRGATASLNVRVLPGNIAGLALTPARPSVRQGDVVQLAVSARDAAGKCGRRAHADVELLSR